MTGKTMTRAFAAAANTGRFVAVAVIITSAPATVAPEVSVTIPVNSAVET